MIAGKKIGPFEIERELGSGAMGSVYRALYTENGKRVAIKIIAPGLASNETALARFEREAAILKQLRHPNIVRLYATGRYHGTPFYAMEYIEGESLDKVIQRRGRLTWEEVVTLGRQLCDALQHAHQQGIIHRDLKPSNLMILPDGTLKLTDFGIAKDLDVTQLTSANCTVGTAAYMSPEQCKGERDLTNKSDLYSLGIVFYELLTGRKPFVADTPMDMFLQHVQGTFERPSKQFLEVPLWLDTLVCQMMEKKPEQRPMDAATVGEALSRVQEKVEAQQSAGVEAAQARAGDRPRNQPQLDDIDKEAARTLLGPGKRKKRKRRKVPVYRRVWFQAAVLTTLLLGIVWVFYAAFFKPPNPDKLFEKAQALMASTDPTDHDLALKGPIAEYLKSYPDRNDAQARQVREWRDQADCDKCERQLLVWIKLDRPPDEDEERLARKAIKLEEAGDFAEALTSWQALAKAKGAEGKNAWGLLGEKRLADLKKVEKHEQELRGKVSSAWERFEDKFKPANDREKAMLAEVTAPPPKKDREAWEKHLGRAKELWEKQKKNYDKEGGDRVWYLLAAKRQAELTALLARKESS
jgi:serine/threonine-protein kinase